MSTISGEDQQVKGRISHEFENFSISDSSCPDFRNTPWLMYGGNSPNDVTYCCGVVTGSKDQTTIEGIEVPLRPDPAFERFRKLLGSYRFEKRAKVHYLESNPSYSVTATIIGRFFAGKPGAIGRGFGHMECCTLLAIEQVASIDKVVSNIKPGESSCYTDSWRENSDDDVLVSRHDQIVKSDEQWRKTDAQRVATEALTTYLKNRNVVLEFKGCKNQHLTYPDKRHDQYQTTCQWLSKPSDSYSVEVMKYYFLKSRSNSWKHIAWMPYQILHRHCSENSEPELR